MTEEKSHTATLSDGASSLPAQPDTQSLVHVLLDTLRNIELEFELERSKIADSTRDVNLKIRVLEKVRAFHRARWEPYIQQIAMLQQRALSDQT